MVACLTPQDAFFEENILTLSYALKATNIVLQPLNAFDQAKEYKRRFQRPDVESPINKKRKSTEHD